MFHPGERRGPVARAVLVGATRYSAAFATGPRPSPGWSNSVDSAYPSGSSALLSADWSVVRCVAGAAAVMAVASASE